MQLIEKAIVTYCLGVHYTVTYNEKQSGAFNILMMILINIITDVDIDININ